MNNDNIPFAFQFLESVKDVDIQIPEYDETECISYVYDDNIKIPFVEWSKIFLGTKTGDTTKVLIDSPDEDE